MHNDSIIVIGLLSFRLRSLGAPERASPSYAHQGRGIALGSIFVFIPTSTEPYFDFDAPPSHAFKMPFSHAMRVSLSDP